MSCNTNKYELYKRAYVIDGETRDVIICDHCQYMCSCSLSQKRCSSCKGAAECKVWIESAEYIEARALYEQKCKEWSTKFPKLSCLHPKNQYACSKITGSSYFGISDEYQNARLAFLNKY